MSKLMKNSFFCLLSFFGTNIFAVNEFPPDQLSPDQLFFDELLLNEFSLDEFLSSDEYLNPRPIARRNLFGTHWPIPVMTSNTKKLIEVQSSYQNPSSSHDEKIIFFHALHQALLQYIKQPSYTKKLTPFGSETVKIVTTDIDGTAQRIVHLNGVHAPNSVIYAPENQVQSSIETAPEYLPNSSHVSSTPLSLPPRIIAHPFPNETNEYINFIYQSLMQAAVIAIECSSKHYLIANKRDSEDQITLTYLYAQLQDDRSEDVALKYAKFYINRIIAREDLRNR